MQWGVVPSITWNMPEAVALQDALECPSSVRRNAAGDQDDDSRDCQTKTEHRDVLHPARQQQWPSVHAEQRGSFAFILVSQIGRIMILISSQANLLTHFLTRTTSSTSKRTLVMAFRKCVNIHEDKETAIQVVI